MRCVHTFDSAPYVLGALSPVEREDYERHMARCPACRDEVAELAVLPGLLGRLERATAEAVGAGSVYDEALDAGGIAVELADGTAESPAQCPAVVEAGRVEAGRAEGTPDATVLPMVLTKVRERRARERSRSRWRTTGVALAAACLALAAVLGAQALRRPADPPAGHGPAAVAMQPVVAHPPVTGWITVESFDGGSRVSLRCRYTAGGNGRWVLSLVVVPRTGTPERIGSWSAGYGEEETLASTTALRVADIERVDLRDETGVTLLTYHP